MTPQEYNQSVDIVDIVHSDKHKETTALDRLLVSKGYKHPLSLGKGGYGEVVLVEDNGRKLALKVVDGYKQARNEGLNKEEPLRLLRKEATLMERARVYGARIPRLQGEPNEFENLLYLPMEYVRGDILEKGSLEEAIDQGIEIARTVDLINQAGVVHNDLKPSNIMRTPKGEIYILDFGCAESSDLRNTSDKISGTVTYMAPEIMDGDPGTPKSDQFNVAETIYFLSAGTPAFGTGEGRLMRQFYRRGRAIKCQEYDRLYDLFPENKEALRLGLALGTALKEDPKDRYDSMTALAHKLERIRS